MMKHFIFAIVSMAAFTLTSAASAGQLQTYTHDETTLEGYLAVPDKQDYGDRRPAILIAHQWKGLSDYEKRRADMLAKKGYVAFALDVYGQGVRPETQEAAREESSKYKGDAELARGRMMAALDHVRDMQRVDKQDIAVIGYCFGGTMALELARSGADIDGAVSFHGGLATDEEAEKGDIQTAIQVHHGAADPHVDEDEVEDFREEMREANADWHFISYADAVHAFTEKDVGNDPSTGVAYNAKADKRSWAYTLAFFEQEFDTEF